MSEYEYETCEQVSMVRFTHKGETIEVEVDDCEFLGIEEDMQGRDKLTFKYEGKEYTAYPVTRGKEKSRITERA